jgi:hypothetical protein
MVEVGTWILFTKLTPKKTAIKKKSTVSDREFDSLSDTVEFFDLRIFSLCELLWKISASEFVKDTVNIAIYARNTLLLLICINTADSGKSAVIIRYWDSLCKIYSTRISILIRCHALRF